MLWWRFLALEEYGSLRLKRCLTFVWYTLTLRPMLEDAYNEKIKFKQKCCFKCFSLSMVSHEKIMKVLSIIDNSCQAF